VDTPTISTESLQLASIIVDTLVQAGKIGPDSANGLFCIISDALEGSPIIRDSALADIQDVAAHMERTVYQIQAQSFSEEVPS